MVDKSQNKIEVLKLFNSILNDESVKKYLELIRAHHYETYEHSLRVGFLSMYLGYENSFSKHELKLLGYAGLLHDLGKIDIPREILSKQARLTPEEMRKMREHPREGFFRLQNFKIAPIKEIIVRSHEYQINSYPRSAERRKEKRIGIKERRRPKKEYKKLTQIIAMADEYDALANKRSYKKSLDSRQIKRILEKGYKGQKKYINQIFKISKENKKMTKIHYESFIDLKYTPKKTDVLIQYKITPAKGYTFREVASIVAGESSVGTWTEISTVNIETQKKIEPKVFYLDPQNKRIRIAYPIDLFEKGNLPEILSSIGGNIFGMKSVKGIYWEDIGIPKRMLKGFKGPQFGIKGIRKLLNVKKRPLVGTIVKPKVGLNEAEHAQVAYEAWMGGCDIVKDDENLTNQSFNGFKQRFLKTIKLMKKAEKETHEKKAYLVNCTAETKEMLKRIKFVEDNGGNYIMLDILTLGWGALQTARNFTKLPIHAHRAGHAMFDRNPEHGMSMEVIAELARMVGVDTLHIGTAYGKMSGDKKEILHIEKEIESDSTQKTKRYLEQKWHGIKPVLGVASGGVYPALVPKIIEFMGNDVVIQAGGGIHGHTFGTRAGAKAMRQAVDATLKKISLQKYAKTHRELSDALARWE